MRITTSQMFDRPTARMSALTAQADRIQAQISTGKRVVAASDDPAAYQALERLARADADDAAWSANVKLAQGVLSQADTTLASVETRLQRAQEIAIASSNGTLSASNRIAYASELNAIVDELLTVANGSDVRGQPLFGGSNGAAPFTRAADGSISYTGQGEPTAIPVGDGNAIATGVTGDRAFGDMFATLAAIGAALSNNEVPPGEATEGLDAALDQVNAARASIGARTIRLDYAAARIADTQIDREAARNDLEAVDVSAAITELQKTLTILQATQSSFTKLSGLSLFDYLR
jgi:flagellar hook-associated protein 3 FlgL